MHTDSILVLVTAGWRTGAINFRTYIVVTVYVSYSLQLLNSFYSPSCDRAFPYAIYILYLRHQRKITLCVAILSKL